MLQTAQAENKAKGEERRTEHGTGEVSRRDNQKVRLTSSFSTTKHAAQVIWSADDFQSTDEADRSPQILHPLTALGPNSLHT